MGGTNIIYITKSDECKEILEKFLTLFKKTNHIKEIQKIDDGNNVLSKPSVLVFFNRPMLVQDVEGTLGNLISNGNFLMIIIVSYGTADQQTPIPVFTMDSKVCMWTSISGSNGNKCTKTPENIRANCILDCFLSIILNPDHAKMEVDEDIDNQLQMKTAIEEAHRSISVSSKGQNVNEDSRDDSVRVICPGISKHYFEPFAKFMKTYMGLSTRLVYDSNNSNRTPLVALCVQYDDTERDIKALEKLIAGSKATLVMIIECAQNVPPITTQPSLNESVFPNFVRLLYNTSDCEVYDCEEPNSTVDLLRIIWSDYDIIDSKSPGKLKEKSITPKASKFFRHTYPSGTRGTQNSKSTQNPDSKMSLMARSNQGLMTANSKDIALLCTRQSEVCKNIFMNIKRQCSIQRDIPWISKIEEANKSNKIILICLKISRLTDDIADATKMAGFAANQKYFLVIIHTIEPGVDPDISVPMEDERILDVANILYSETVGCYDCPENRDAKSKISSWFTQTK